MDIKRRVLLTATTLAERIHIDEKTLANWRSAGRGPPYFKIGMRVLYDETDVAQWIETRRVNTTPRPTLVHSFSRRRR